ncbi:hypothetical protein JCM10213_001275 [Rhodosporidiobolus nylandii]
MPSHADLTASLSRYAAALALRAKASKSSKDLVELDAWYRGDLRQLVADRRKANEDSKAQLTREELGRLMEWKLARGKFRPRLQDLVLSNPPSLVSSTSSIASCTAPADALSQLSSLKGVGPATASAVLALWHPETEPFMSDEALENCDEYGEGKDGKGKKEYTVKAWRGYREKMQERKEKEGWESVEDLEKALWSWAVERKYGEDEDRPAQDAKKGAKESASTGGEETAPSATKKRKS